MRDATTLIIVGAALLVAGYINIYSPYTAAVICDHTEER